MKTLVHKLLTALLLLLPFGISAQDSQWFGISLDFGDTRYTPNKTVYETSGGYKNNWVKIEMLTPEAREKEEGCYSKTWLLQYRSDFHEYRIIALQTFDENGKLIISEEDPYATWHHVMPESLIEWLAKQAKGLFENSGSK